MSETLSIPEESLAEVIAVIRAGLKATKDNKQISRETKRNLKNWCDEETAYLEEIEADDAA